MAETPADRYNRLSDELQQLRRIQPADRTPDHTTRHRALAAQLREILATPPDGYTLPKAAADLVTHAQSCGWLAQVQWTPPGDTGQPLVKIQVGRIATPEEVERADYYSDRWLYQLTWHSRDCPAGKLRRFGNGLCNTPQNRAAETRSAPSIKRIREVIAAHPGRREAA